MQHDIQPSCYILIPFSVSARNMPPPNQCVHVSRAEHTNAPLAIAMPQGKQYWADERRLCKVMLDAQESHVQEAGFDLLDVHNTSESKSFDYRV